MLALPLLLAAAIVAVARGAPVPCTHESIDADKVPTGCKTCNKVDEDTVTCTECDPKDASGQSYLTKGLASEAGKCITKDACTAKGVVSVNATASKAGECTICDSATQAYDAKTKSCVEFGATNNCKYYEINEDGVNICVSSCPDGKRLENEDSVKCVYSCLDDDLRTTGHCKVCEETSGGTYTCVECAADDGAKTRPNKLYLNVVSDTTDKDNCCLTEAKCREQSGAMAFPAIGEDVAMCQIPDKCSLLKSYPTDDCAGPVFVDACFGLIGCDACGVGFDEDGNRKPYCLHCAYGKALKGVCVFESSASNIPHCNACAKRGDGEDAVEDRFRCADNGCEEGYQVNEAGICVPTGSGADDNCQVYAESEGCAFCKAGTVEGSDGKCAAPTTPIPNCKFYADAENCALCNAGFYVAKNDDGKDACTKATEASCASASCGECSSDGSTCKLCADGKGFKDDGACENCKNLRNCLLSSDRTGALADCKDRYTPIPDMAKTLLTCEAIPADTCPPGKRAGTGTEADCVDCKIENCAVCAVKQGSETCGTCLAGYLPSTDKSSCVKIPEGCTALPNDDGSCKTGKCSKVGYYEVKSGEGAECRSCGKGCTTCKLEGEAVSCTACDSATGFWLNSTSKACEECPAATRCASACTAAAKCTEPRDGFYKKDDDYLSCDASCKKCSDDKTCSECATGYEWDQVFDVEKRTVAPSSTVCVTKLEGCQETKAATPLNQYGVPQDVEIVCRKCADQTLSFVATETASGLYTTECAVEKDDDGKPNDQGGLSTGAIVGIVIAVIVVVAAIVLGCVFGIKACKNKKGKQGGNEQALQPISS